MPVARKRLAFARERARHLGPQRAVHVRERDARLLERLAVGEDAGPPAPARRPGPGIFAEAATAVDGLDAGGDPVLQLLKERRRAIVERFRHDRPWLAFAGFSAEIRRTTSRNVASRLRRFSKK